MEYPACKNGYKGVGPVCWGICPQGFTDTGVDCLKPKAYGRGAGHISQDKCQRSSDHGATTNGCEKNGLLWYPKCDTGFHNVACCVCSPNCPDGFKDVGISCQKPSYGRGVGTLKIFGDIKIVLIIVGVLVGLFVLFIFIILLRAALG